VSIARFTGSAAWRATPSHLLSVLRGEIELAKTLNERITETQEKIGQYENQVKRLIQQQKQAERKARTRRLIERGALLESFLAEPEALSNEQVKEILMKWCASHNAR